MHRRQYLQAAGGLAGSAALAGCGWFGGTDGVEAPGISADGVDPATVAATARDRMTDAPYEFEWRTEGDRLGTEFFQAIHDKADRQLLLRNREGGAYSVAYYTADAAYRNTAPDDPAAEDRFEVPDRDLAALVETLPAALERIVRVWVSGYEYDAPEQRDAGIRLDIVGGYSQVPYRLENARGHLLVSEEGVIRELQVVGTPVSDSADGEPRRLDSQLEARLSFETDGVEVTEPDWVAEARQSQ